MSLFSQSFDRTSEAVRRIVAEGRAPAPERLEVLLARSAEEPLSLDELGELLQIGRTPGAEAAFERLRDFVRRSWRKPEGNAVRYVAPIYVSSFCVDTCPYCNFSARRTEAVRRRLSPDELDEEVRAVMERGARVIELVYATDPENSAERLARSIERTRAALGGEPGSAVLLCTEYLHRQTYETLREAGLSGIVQWDETLDPEAYHRWHASSPHKREFRLRMDNHDRAMAAGLGVATGALFGLADSRYDALMQVAKARHLAREYGRGPFVFGVPRLKPIGGRELHFQTEVDDRAYETALLVYRLAMPDAGRWLQTRETFELNLRNLLDGDVFTYRCGLVQPGGYKGSAAAARGGQFGVNELERDFVERELTRQGFGIDYRWAAAGVLTEPDDSLAARA
jgi:2-iminoacetate synthase